MKRWVQPPPKPQPQPPFLRSYLYPRNTNRAQKTFKASDYTTIYKYPPMPNKPVTIGVVSFGGGLYGAYNSKTCVLTGGDVQKYWASVCGMTSLPTVLVVPVGAGNTPRGSGTDENTLDVTTIGACYPSSNVTIVLYIAPNSIAGFRNAFATAINGTRVNGRTIKSNVISCSWGASEVSWGASTCKTMDGLFAQAKAAGIPICCASGDYGSGNGLPGLNVDFPASSPNVIACGGTSLVCPTLVWDISTVETVWNAGGAATGGGVSTIFPRPAYQTWSLSTMRSLPDIAMNADPNTGVSILLNGVTYICGGTSIVAPAMAAFVARCPKPCHVDSIYKAPATCFNDITSGNNGTWAAAGGFDLCTGRGSLIGTALSAAL